MKRYLVLILLLAAYISHKGLWAEPDPPEITAFSVTINKPSYKGLEEELVVKELTDDLSEEIYCDSIEYLALCVEAEAGNEPIEGRRMVIDAILNRVDSPAFPGDIRSVIDQCGQFSVVGNGAIDRVSPSEGTWEAVRSELENRTNTEVIYFRAGRYHDCGHPLFKVGRHYFSK